MLLTHHMDNFKLWTPPHTKSFSQHKSHKSRTPRASNFTHPNPRHDSLTSTLPFPKHSLPARPPAEVCVNISTNTQPASPPGPAPHTSNSDEISYDFQDITDTPIEPPFFREDTVEDGPSSPSMSSSDDSLKEFFRLPDIQNGIPIDPLILANDGILETSDLHQPVLQDDSLIISETICPYPEPPPILHHIPDHHRVSSERPRSQNGNIQTRDQAHAHAHIQSPGQLRPSHPNSETGTSCSSGASKNLHGKPSKKYKRKRHQSEGQAPKRLRDLSTMPATEDSFTSLRSHFLCLPLDERLQFLSWLFEGALPRCMPDTGPTTCENRDVQSTSRSIPQHEIEQTQRNCGEAQGSSRKGMLWSPEEAALLLKLRRDERRPWSEVIRLFSDKYPGRSPGSIQVFWSTTLKNKTFAACGI
ncbi:hypothetical protein BDV24DRAFT_156818 [Aspergillus arachidicola]|uniref:Myb-like domain-containing protein n=1 Tax=Aspergillus arachidicola TaxID=656916 RepID=A0A5N6XQT2_9EURO|nr:hypothetical protein BDV24DRAFT_156818 [Aspergillus arachidicola]